MSDYTNGTTTPLHTRERVSRFAEEAVEAAAEHERVLGDYLKARGWRHTCTTPGAMWMWEKQLPDGRTVLLPNAGHALRFEDFLS